MAKTESETSSSSSSSSSSDSDSSSSEEQAPVEAETSETRGTSSAAKKDDDDDTDATKPAKKASSSSASSSSSSGSSSYSSDSDEDVLREKIIKLKAELKDASANEPAAEKTDTEVAVREKESAPEEQFPEEPNNDEKPPPEVAVPDPNTSEEPSEPQPVPEAEQVDVNKRTSEPSESQENDKTEGESKDAEAKSSSPQKQKETPDEDAPLMKKRKTEEVPETKAPAKEPAKHKSSADGGRSPDRRERRRSRDRTDRSRRQRSRSRSRDRRRRRSRSRSRSKDRIRDRSSDRRRRRSPQKPSEDGNEPTNPNEKISERQRRTVDLLTSRTGGAYIPPAKLRMMQAEITDKASAAYQRIAWEALKKSIHGYINKVNVDNIGIITRELLKENIVRGRGLLCRSIIQAQAASPTFTHVYAALVAIINSKFPNIGELLLKRLVIQFKRAFRRNDKAICLSASRFIAHLVNQRVAHEILALEILTLLVETPTDDSVEVAIAFLKECGMKLTEVSSKGIGAIFEMLKNILHEGKLDKRVQYMIEVVFQVRKDGFKDHQSVIEALELVEEDDQFTHLLMLDEATNTEDNLNAFKFDDKYETNEDKYKGLSKEILGSDASDSDDDDSGSGTDESDTEEDDEEKAREAAIIDNTETNLVALRRTIYLTINSSLDYEECAHKLMKMQLKPGQEIELCHMFLDCCAEQRTYEKFYGLLAQRFCSINKTYIEPFEEIFKDTYQTTHRLDTNRLRNVSKFFAHLLFTDAIGWDVIECIKLNEDDTTSSSRIFIKILFQELAEYMGLGKLNQKLKDEVLTESLAGLFPKDNPRNTRFAINFFTSIGLGGLTDDLRQFLKSAPKSVPAINSELLPDKIEVSSTSSSSTSSSSSSSSSPTTSSPSSPSNSDDSSEESSSEDGKRKGKKKKKYSRQKLMEKTKKKRSKDKNKKSKKKREPSSSETVSSDSTSSSSDTSSDSSSASSSSDSSSEEERHKSKNRPRSKKVLKKKASKNQLQESFSKKSDKKDLKYKSISKKDSVDQKVSNGKAKSVRDRDNKRRDRDEKAPHDRGRRRDDRDRDDHRDSYSQSGRKRIHEHKSSRNASKERG